MTITSEKLIQDLIERTRININQAEKFSLLSTEKLNWRAENDSWSILECFEHLNLYGDFYISEIKKRIENSNTQPKENFKSGLLGNYFAKDVQSLLRFHQNWTSSIAVCFLLPDDNALDRRKSFRASELIP